MNENPKRVLDTSRVHVVKKRLKKLNKGCVMLYHDAGTIWNTNDREMFLRNECLPESNEFFKTVLSVPAEVLEALCSA